MRATMDAIGQIAEQLTPSPAILAEQILEAMVADGYGAFDHAIEALAPELGPEGLAAPKDKATAACEAPITAADLARHDYVRKADRESRARQSRNSTLERILLDVADQQGDVDGWMAKYAAEQLTYHTIASNAATRLLDAGRPEEALALIRTALAALGHKDALCDALWARYEAWLCPDALRHHLKLLPDFEYIDAADATRAIVMAYPSMSKALW